ncbi:MAG: hypothetical protein QME42_03840 [bacterium]|nr:hypothetical protein [bacterium]
MNMKERSELRKKRIVGYRARDFADAQRWDLEFWQNQSPDTRLSALVAIRNDVAKVIGSRESLPEKEL